MSGFITILPEQVTIMAEVVEWPDEIDYAACRGSTFPCGAPSCSREADLDVVRAEAALKRALVRLNLRH